MAKKDRINLIDEFKSQKNNDYILLTTYTFDPIFFDNFLLRELIHNNPSSEIVVLVDSEQYERSYDEFTPFTGLKYHLVPIYTNRVSSIQKSFYSFLILKSHITWGAETYHSKVSPKMQN